VTEFGSLNHSPGKRVLNNLKTICPSVLSITQPSVSKNGVIMYTFNNGKWSFVLKFREETTHALTVNKDWNYESPCLLYVITLKHNWSGSVRRSKVRSQV